MKKRCQMTQDRLNENEEVKLKKVVLELNFVNLEPQNVRG